jgi:hypothetical protein
MICCAELYNGQPPSVCCQFPATATPTGNNRQRHAIAEDVQRSSLRFSLNFEGVFIKFRAQDAVLLHDSPRGAQQVLDGEHFRLPVEARQASGSVDNGIMGIKRCQWVWEQKPRRDHTMTAPNRHGGNARDPWPLVPFGWRHSFRLNNSSVLCRDFNVTIAVSRTSSDTPGRQSL